MEQINKTKDSNQAIIALGISLLLIWGGFYLSYPNFLELQKKAEQANIKKVAEKRKANQKQAFGNLNLEAKAFAVYDIEKEELIASKDENQVLPLASITKVMTVLVATDNLNSKTPVTIKQTLETNNGGLRQGEKWSLANLAALTLVGSSNAGAIALAEASSTINFVEQMNTKATTLGLTDLHFVNPTGLDEDFKPGGEGSALSVAKLFTHIVKTRPELLSATREAVITEKSQDNFKHIVLNTNEIVNDLPGLLASKTGLTDLAGGNLAIVANLGLRRPITIVVLGSSEQGRFIDTKKLVEASLNYYTNLN